MKIKKVTRSEQVEEIDLQLPYYFKVGDCYYAMVEDDKAFEVNSFQINRWLCADTLSLYYSKPEKVEITREDFISAFDKAVEKLQQFIKTESK